MCLEGCLVTFRSETQKFVTLTVTEAEGRINMSNYCSCSGYAIYVPVVGIDNWATGGITYVA